MTTAADISPEAVERAAAHLADRSLSINFDDAQAFADMLRALRSALTAAQIERDEALTNLHDDMMDLRRSLTASEKDAARWREHVSKRKQRVMEKANG